MTGPHFKRLSGDHLLRPKLQYCFQTKSHLPVLLNSKVLRPLFLNSRGRKSKKNGIYGCIQLIHIAVQKT